MSIRTARAAVNPKLVVLLVALAVVAGSYWLYRYVSERGDGEVPPERIMYCSTCGEVPVKSADLTKLTKKWEGVPPRFQCPNCSQFSLTFEEPKKTPEGVMSP